MSGNGVNVPLRWQIQVTGAQEAKQRLAELDQQFSKGQMSIGDYAKKSREQERIVKSLTNEQRIQKEVYLASNPALNSFAKSMSTVGAVSNTLLGITNAINLAQLASIGVNGKVTAATQQLAADQRQYQIDLRDFPNDVALHEADLAKIAADQTNLSLVTRDASYQMITNWITFGSAVALSANQIIQTYTTLAPKIKNLSQGMQDAIGVAGLGGAFVLLGALALASGEMVGSSLNQNKEALSEFRAELDKQFGDNPFTNYIIFPLATMIDELNGNKADWKNDLTAMGDAWANFANPVIDTINTIRDFLHHGDKTGDFLHVKTSSEIAQAAHANNINNMLVGQPFNSVNPEQKKQTEVLTTTQQIINDAKKTANDLVNSIQVSTNPTLQKVSDGITTSNSLLQGLVDTAAQTNARAVYQNQLQTQTNQAAQIQSQIDQINANRMTFPSSGSVDQDFNGAQYNAIMNANNAKIDAQIKPLQDQLKQLEVGTQASLTSYLGSIGLSGNYGIGSVVSGALGGASAGWTAQDVQDFIQTHDYGVFTRAANRDNGVAHVPTQQEQINAWMKATGGSAADAKYALHYSASGFDGIVSSATSFVAGESGAEKVSIRPVGSGSSSGQNVNNFYITVQGTVIAENNLRDLISKYNKQGLKSRGFSL